MKQRRNIKVVLIILITLLSINVFSITKVGIYSILANDDNNSNINNNTNNNNNTNSTNNNNNDDEDKEVEETTIELFKNKEDDNKPFNVTNMFPGDSYTKYYNVKVNYHSNVTVYFNVDITKEENIEQGLPEDEAYTNQINTDDNDDNHKLSEVLKVKINVLNLDNNKSKTLYDGLMKNISGKKSITYNLTTSKSTSSKLRYEIIVYLDTSVNNDFQHKALTADFNWWVEDTKNLDPSDDILWKVVDTGVGLDYIRNNTNLYLTISIMLALINISGIIYILLILNRSKEDY